MTTKISTNVINLSFIHIFFTANLVKMADLVKMTAVFKAQNFTVFTADLVIVVAK